MKNNSVFPYKKSDFTSVNFEVKVYNDKAIPSKFSDFGIFGKKTIISFELFNNGCNTDILIGKGLNFYPIPQGQPKGFFLDGLLKWSALADKEIKVKPTDYKLSDCNGVPLPEKSELILIYYETLFC
ncbi:MAG: hypothetical protein AAGJ18_31235 [Bacteroidota bacterium]